MIQVQVCVDTDKNKSIHISTFTLARSDFTEYEVKFANALEDAINHFLVSASKKTKGFKTEITYFDDDKETK